MTDRAPTATLGEESARYLLDVVAKRDPYAFLERLRQTEPVHRSDAGTWIVTDFDLCVAGLRDPRFSRSAAVAHEVDIMLDPGEARSVYRSRMMNQDGVDHIRLRRLLSATFAPPSVDAWRPAIEVAVDELFDHVVPKGSGDLARDVAYPVPEHIICTLLGVPFEDHALYERWASIINIRPLAGGVDAERRRDTTQAWDEFIVYLRDLVAERRARPADDLISRLVAIEDEGDRLNDTETVAILTEVINGGHDTTANSIINGMLMFLLHPEQYARLVADPELAASAADEVLRFRSPVQTTLIRRTSEDVELGGVMIPEGSTVVFALAAANRQGERLPDPDVFDIGRSANRHIAFGNGRHVCLGQHLARVELELTLDRFARRMPDIELAASLDDLTWRSTTLVMAPVNLPVTW